MKRLSKSPVLRVAAQGTTGTLACASHTPVPRRALLPLWAIVRLPLSSCLIPRACIRDTMSGDPYAEVATSRACRMVCAGIDRDARLGPNGGVACETHTGPAQNCRGAPGI